MYVVPSPGFEPGCLATLSSELSAYAVPPGRDRSRKWRTGRDSNPQHAVLETAALPVALPVQSENQMLPASGSRKTHQPLMHITCFKVWTTSTSSACAAMTASMLL